MVLWGDQLPDFIICGRTGSIENENNAPKELGMKNKRNILD